MIQSAAVFNYWFTLFHNLLLYFTTGSIFVIIFRIRLLCVKACGHFMSQSVAVNNLGYFGP